MTSIKISNARLFDPVTGEETISEIGVRDGRIFSLGHVNDSSVDRVVDVGTRIVVPSLIDLHTHVYHLATSLGVNPDRVADSSGVRILVDAGSAGAGNFPGLLEYVIRTSRCKIYAFLNIGFGGIPFFGIGKKTQVGEIPDLQVADEENCVECIRSNPNVIVGIKVRLSWLANGSLGVKPLLAAKRCAHEARCPVMVHFGNPPPKLEEILPLLEQGDILTHTFRPPPNSILTESDWRVLSAVREAKSRGVLCDVGHGNGSFSFKVAGAALEQGLQPDTISTDIHAYSIDYPVGDLPTTMTKFLTLGMSLPDVLKSVTYTPASAIKKLDVHGRIQPGMPADLTVLDIKERRRPIFDAAGEKIESGQSIEPYMRFVNGDPAKIDYIPPATIPHA